MKNFWENFKEGKVSVTFNNDGDLMEFLEACQSQGIVWHGGGMALDFTDFAYSHDEMYIKVNRDKAMMYGKIGNTLNDRLTYKWNYGFEINWKEFIEGKTAVQFRSGSDLSDFLKTCELRDIKWIDGDKATQFANFLYKADDFCIKIEDGDLAYSDKDCELEKEIVTWGKGFNLSSSELITEIKEGFEEVEIEKGALRFKDVIANIKDGDIWETIDHDRLKTISMDDSNIYFEFEDDGNGVSVGKSLYKLREPKKMAFSEAYREYKNGKTIKSLWGGEVYRPDDKDLVVAEEEIEGEWIVL